MYLLYADVLMAIQREYALALTWFAALTELPAVPGLVVMELIQDAQNAHQVRQALKLVAPLPVVWPTAADCQRALTDCIAYPLSHSLGVLDALIAACAIGISATLRTFNVKHYRVVPGLVMVQPYTR
jgi:predicted nucleic acid-binding protein